MSRASLPRCLRVFATALVIWAVPLVVMAEPTGTRGMAAADGGRLTFAPSGWTSSLYPRDWTPGYADDQGRSVTDFSYAGYARGASAIPSGEGSLTVDVTQAPFSVSPTSTADVTAQLQAALDYVGEAGGGVVYLPAGTYRVSRPASETASLRIRHSGVVLRGAGRGRTLLLNTTTSMRQSSVIRAMPDEPSYWGSAPVESLPNLVADSPAGSSHVVVANPADFHAGDLVVVRTEATPEWVAEHGNPRNWDADSMDATTYLRRVEAVGGDGTLQLDIPLRTDVLVRDRGDRANVYRAGTHLSGVGVEDLSVGMMPHRADSRYASDTNEASAIRYRNVTDSWIRRVSSYRPATSSLKYHLLSEGIWLDTCRNVTVSGCVMAYPQNRDAGNGNGYVIRGSDNLIEECAAVESRHAYSFGYVHATGNVLRDSVSARPTLYTDFHMWFSAANLIENMWMDGDGVDASFRDDGRNTVHGHTTSQSLIWNIRGVRPRAATPLAPLVNSVQWGWGAVVGTSGTPYRVASDPDVDGVDGDRTLDLVEGVTWGRTLVPQSLYLDQKRRRESGRSDDVVAEGTVRPVTVEAVVKRGTARVSALSGRTLLLRTGDRQLITFDVSDTRRVERAVLVFDGRVGPSQARLTVRGLSANTPTASATTIAAVTHTRNRPSPWVVDVSEFVRAKTAAGAASVTFSVTQDTPDSAVLLHTGLDDDASRRPRLELVTAPDARLEVARVQLGARKSLAAVDSSLSTVYSGSPRPSVTLDFDETRTVSAVGVAFGNGSRNFGFVDVWASGDGIAWRPVGAVVGSGVTEGYQTTRLAEAVQARFIRFIGIGSSDPRYPTTTWLREVEVYGE